MPGYYINSCYLSITFFFDKKLPLNYIIITFDSVFLAGDSLYDSATRMQITDLPAFSLECLPNRNSLVYGDFYGIGSEASTIFRGTLRYEGILIFV